MLLRTCDGRRINTDHVRSLSVREVPDVLYQLVLEYEYANGDTGQVFIYRSEWEQFNELRERSIIVPALPGYLLLMFNEDDGSVDRWPVLAWRFDLDDAFHRAVTVWTALHESEGPRNVVLCPDGRVVSLGDSVWESE